MADYWPAELVIYVPRGGHKELARRFRAYKADPNRHAKAKVALKGGTIRLRDAQACGGVHEWRDHLPPDIDYDHHSEGKYEYVALIQWRRRGHVTQRQSDQEGNILLAKSDLEAFLKEGTENLAERLLAAFEKPPPSYEVGPLEHEEESS